MMDIGLRMGSDASHCRCTKVPARARAAMEGERNRMLFCLPA
jgi:hypothetical protein